MRWLDGNTDSMDMSLGDPMDCSLPGSSVHGVLQAIILEWVAIPFSRGILSEPFVLGFLTRCHEGIS